MSHLTKPVLVLNRNWQALNFQPVQRALVLVWNGHARIVDPSDYSQYTWEDWKMLKPGAEDPKIIGISFALRVPSIITLAQYDRVPTGTVTFNRRNIFKRDHYVCQYCHKQTKELTIDHVLPKSRGGKSTWENCVAACVDCNFRKADRTPAEAK